PSRFGLPRSLEQLLSPMAFTPNSSLDPCAKETVLNAIKESRKRAVEEEEEDQAFGNDQESKRRRHDSSGSGQSAFEPLVANGAPASLIPKPGSLKRGLVSHCLDDCSNKRSRTSSMSSLNTSCAGGIPSSVRNAIASSYSSSRGLAQLWKTSGVSVSPLSSPASSRSQTPEWPLKKAREEESLRSNASTPVKSDKELQTEKVVETPVRKQQNSLSSPSVLGSSGKRKRKIQLLSSRRGDQLALPPPPQLGYSITSEDLDAEKKAALQWFNKVLEDKADAAPSTTAETTPQPRPLAFTVTSPGPAPVATTAPASNKSLLDSLKKMQSNQAAPVPADSSGATVVSPPSSSALQLLAPPASLESSLLPVTSADTKPMPVLSITAPSAPPASGAQPASSLASPSSTELGQTPSKPSSFPKPSILFGMLSTPPASQPATTAPAAAPTTTTPVFKPIFGAPLKSESPAPCTTVVSAAVVSASPGPSSTSAAATMFKPIFGSVTAASSPAKASPFAFKPTAQPASAADPTTASTTAPAAAQPFLFGGPASSAPSTDSSFAASGPVFQFGKTAPATVSATTSVPGGSAFGQAPSTTTAPTTAAGFSIFGGTALTSTPATTGQSTQPPASKAPTGPVAFGPSFPFGAPAAQPAAQTPFGSSAQPPFGATSTQGSFGTSSSQAAFGTTTSVFSFGTATTTTASFGPSTQTTSSSGGTAAPGTGPSPFTFGASAQPGPSASAFGIGTPAPSSAFGSSLPQSALGAQNQSSPFAFSVPSTPDNKPVFGGTPAPTFGQSTPVPGAVGSGSSSLSFGTPSTPASGFGGVGTSFGSSTPAFSIGAGSKTGARQRLQGRRQ
ncbi:Nuclear envelope pore membrane protein POM 121, partial [Tinamus guttatus]